MLSRSRHQFFLCLVLGSNLFLSCSGARNTRSNSWLQEAVPSPIRDVWDCGRMGKPSWICDPDNLLSTQEEGDRIDQAIEDFRLQTDPQNCRCDDPIYCRVERLDTHLRDPRGDGTNNTYHMSLPWNGGPGWKAGVLLVREIELDWYHSLDDDDIDVDIRRYASHVMEKTWRFGHCQDDLLLLIAVEQGYIQTSIGSELKKHLSLSCVISVNHENSNYVNSGDYAGGIWSLISTYRDIINGHKSCSRISTEIVYSIIGGCVLIFAIAYMLVRGRLRRHPKWSQKRWLQMMCCFPPPPFRLAQQSEIPDVEFSSSGNNKNPDELSDDEL